MLKEKRLNRRLILLAAAVVEVCLGVVYAWPVFAEKLLERTGKYSFTDAQVHWIFTLILLSFTVAVFVAGQVMERTGPKKLLLAGGAALGLGYLLGGIFGDSFAGQLIFVGILAGVGAGLAYLVPPAFIIRWFPDMKGMALGICLAGYGLGIIFWSSLAGAWFTINLMGIGGLQSVYFLYGLMIWVGIAAGGLILTDPPWGYMPQGSAMGNASSGLVNFEPREMIRDRQFYLLTAVFFLSTLVSMVVMENVDAYGAYALKVKGLELKISVKVAQLAAFLTQVMVGAGCVIWGVLYDHLERKVVLSLMCFFQGIVVFLLYYMAGSPQSLIFFSCLAGLGIGANFVLFLAITGDYFGDKNLGINYAWVFPVAGMAAAAAPQIAFYVQAAAKEGQVAFIWKWLFLSAGTISLIGALIALLLKVPRKVS